MGFFFLLALHQQRQTDPLSNMSTRGTDQVLLGCEGSVRSETSRGDLPAAKCLNSQSSSIHASMHPLVWYRSCFLTTLFSGREKTKTESLLQQNSALRFNKTVSLGGIYCFDYTLKKQTAQKTMKQSINTALARSPPSECALST